MVIYTLLRSFGIEFFKKELKKAEPFLTLSSPLSNSGLDLFIKQP